MAFTKTEDEYGRPVMVLVANETEDGSGTWHALVVDTDGIIKAKGT